MIAAKIEKLIYDAHLFCRPEQLRLDKETLMDLQAEGADLYAPDGRGEFRPFRGLKIIVEARLPIWKKPPTVAPVDMDAPIVPDRILCVAGRCGGAEGRWFYVDWEDK